MGNTLSSVRNSIGQTIFIPKPTLTDKNLPDQYGKVFLITGANSGVGYEVARILYSRHGTVYLACRSASRANAAISSIGSTHPNSRGKLVFLSLDLSDLSTIKPAVQQFLSKEKRLDWLNHNAGVSLADPKVKSAQGYDLTFTTNVLGAFLLTWLLLPVLQDTARTLLTYDEKTQGAVRVSWAGSVVIEVMSPLGGVGFQSDGSPKDYGMNVYAASKAANLFLCREFARRTNDVVLHNCYNPGNLKTNLVNDIREAIWFFPFFFWVLDTFVLFPAVFGAYTELYCGLSRDLSMADQGCYIVPWGRKVGKDHLRSDLMENIGEGKGSEKLWEWCERETSSYM